jgi:hypothetical protein
MKRRNPKTRSGNEAPNCFGFFSISTFCFLLSAFHLTAAPVGTNVVKASASAYVLKVAPAGAPVPALTATTNGAANSGPAVVPPGSHRPMLPERPDVPDEKRPAKTHGVPARKGKAEK